jgi:spermidine/putrescine transport system ATP-binding protein
MLVELDSIHDEVGITFVYVTHDQGEAMSISDHIAVMNQGIIDQIGTPVEVYEAPRSSFVAAFIGDTNFLDGVVSEILDDEYSRLNIDGFTDIIAYNDKKIRLGESIHVSMRPEKFNISREKPEQLKNFNFVRGKIEEIIYFGSHTKYWVRVNEYLISVHKPHQRFLLDEKPISWEDDVWLWWHADNCYMLERYKLDDEELVTLPDSDI